MSHIGLAIHPDTNDLYLDESNQLAIVKDQTAIGEHARQRLKTFHGEWFLDTTAGVSWLSDIMGLQYNPALAEAVVKAEILNTSGVTSINTFSIGFDQSKRNLIVKDIEITTNYGEVKL